MKYKNPLILIMMLFITLSISSAYAGCPNNQNGQYTGYVGIIAYSDDNNYSSFTLSNHPNNFMILSKNSWIHSDKGKHMFNMLIQAKMNFNKITVTCKNQNVDTIVLLDNNDPEEK